jgi:hypothetical protein
MGYGTHSCCLGDSQDDAEEQTETASLPRTASLRRSFEVPSFGIFDNGAASVAAVYIYDIPKSTQNSSLRAIHHC